MNILIIISTLNFGGAEKQAVLDANLLAKQHKVWLVCFTGGSLAELIHPNVTLLLIDKGNYINTAYRLWTIIKINNIDIIHASLYSAMIISSLVTIVSKVAVFWHFHSHEYELPFIHRELYKWMGRLPGIKRILFVNSELKDFYLNRLHYPKSKTEVLYNTSAITPSTAIKRASKQFTIGYIGRIVELKRVNYLLELAEFLKQKRNLKFRILIVGDGEERQKLEELSSKKQLDNVSFEGFQTNTEKYYSQIDVFALPSREECLSMVAIDAGISGIPVVAFNIGGNHEIIVDGQTGYLVDTKEAFFEKIYYLLTHPANLLQMRIDSSSYCHSKFGEKKHLEDLHNLYMRSGLVFD